MGYVPPDARWFFAEIIEEIKVEGHRTSLVHVNTVLINARGAKQAYVKALEAGRNYNQTYKNTENKTVRCRFRGLRDLLVALDDLEHGAEIAYYARPRMKEKQIKKLVSKKSELGVFAPITPVKSPNFYPKSVQDELRRRGFKG